MVGGGGVIGVTPLRGGRMGFGAEGGTGGIESGLFSREGTGGRDLGEIGCGCRSSE